MNGIVEYLEKFVEKSDDSFVGYDPGGNTEVVEMWDIEEAFENKINCVNCKYFNEMICEKKVVKYDDLEPRNFFCAFWDEL